MYAKDNLLGNIAMPYAGLRFIDDFGDSAINKGNIAYFVTAHARNDDISTSDLRTFLVDFFIGKANMRHIFTSGLFGLLT